MCYLEFMEGYTGILRQNRFDDERSREKRGPKPPPTSCEQCGREGVPLTRLRQNTTDRGDGTASFHIVVKWLCEDCLPKRKQRREQVKSEAELKALLRGARRSLR